MLSFHNINFSPVLRDVSGTLGPGQFVGMVGENGAGKTTLLRTLAGLLPADGVILLDSKPLSQWSIAGLASKRGYLTADPLCFWNLTVAEVLDVAGRSTLEIAAQEMRQWHLWPLRQSLMHQLSSGERMRVFLAALFMRDPDLLLLDEPLQHLDPLFQEMVLKKVHDFTRRGKAVLAVFHDLEMVRRWCDGVWVMQKGRLVAQGTPSQVLQALPVAKPCQLVE